MDSYIVGYLCGIAFVLLFAFVIRRFFSKKFPKPVYDERQTLARLKAYQGAFWAALGYLAVGGAILEPVGIGFADTLTFASMGIFFSGTVLAVLCIINDCYFAINQQPKRYFWIFLALAAVNVVFFFVNLGDNSVFTDGKLNSHILNLVAAIVIIIVMIVSLIKAKISSDDKDEE